MSGYFLATVTSSGCNNRLYGTNGVIARYVGLFSCHAGTRAATAAGTRAGVIARYVGLFSCHNRSCGLSHVYSITVDPKTQVKSLETLSMWRILFLSNPYIHPLFLPCLYSRLPRTTFHRKPSFQDSKIRIITLISGMSFIVQSLIHKRFPADRTTFK